MKLSLLDRALLPMAPKFVAGRARARLQVDAMVGMSAGTPGPGGGTGGSGAGTRWWKPFSRDAKGDTLKGLTTQRAASRELYRTNAIASGAINTDVERVVGTGLALVSTPHRGVLGWSEDQAQAWKAHTQAEFSLWADSTQCDWAGEQNFYEIQALVKRSAKTSGDCFTLMPMAERTRMQPYGLRLQVLEADRVGNPMGSADSDTVAGGISFENGRPMAAFIYDSHPGAINWRGSRFKGEWQAFVGSTGRRHLLHHYQKQRPDQPRGVPYLSPVIDLIKQIGRFTESEITAAVLNSFFTIFYESDRPQQSNPLGDSAGASQAASGESDLHPNLNGIDDDSEIGLGMGAVVDMPPGVKANFADPKRPNPNAEGFIHMLVGLIGMGLGIPRELLLKQFNSSYSASKAALLDAWIHFRVERAWTALSLCQPVYETWMAEAVFLGRIKAPGFFASPLLRWAYTRAAWPGDSMGSINPKDEVAAYAAAVDARFMTRERAEWELGGTDWNETFNQKLAEHKRLAANGLLPVPKAGAAAPQATSAKADDTAADPADDAAADGNQPDSKP